MAVRLYRLAPGDGALNPITIPGTNRTYSAAVGGFALVPEPDRQTVDNAGWVLLSGAYGSDVGTTAARPALTSVVPGFHYYDTTLSALLVALGPKTGWANVLTGAIS